MLHEWILQIREDSHYYCSETWKYRISGNVLELSVPLEYTRKKEIYRCSVITVGQILKSLSCKIDQTGSHYLIQSFPNLESPALIASIRMEDQLIKNVDPFPTLPEKCDFESEKSKLITLSQKYQFELTQIEMPAQLQPFTNEDPNRHWFALTTTSDNPFIWLKLGNWKETILKNCNNELNIESPRIVDFCLSPEFKSIDLNLPDKTKIQSLLVFGPETS
ncbi:MAG: hypothetical protein WDZ38_03610 [Balneolaceae bacterium]